MSDLDTPPIPYLTDDRLLTRKQHLVQEIAARHRNHDGSPESACAARPTHPPPGMLALPDQGLAGRHPGTVQLAAVRSEHHLRSSPTVYQRPARHRVQHHRRSSAGAAPALSVDQQRGRGWDTGQYGPAACAPSVTTTARAHD